MLTQSPSGLKIVPSIGPTNAKIVIIGESPASEEMKLGQPLVGKSGKLLNQALVAAGIDRSQCYIMNLVPVRAPGDKFANHVQADKDWGLARAKSELANLTDAKVFITLGANPTEWALGGKPPVAQRGESKREGFISAWRGSAIRVQKLTDASHGKLPEDYNTDIANNSPLPTGSIVVPTFHPAAVLRQFTWHPWFWIDIAKAGEISRNGPPPIKYRKWFFNKPEELLRLADEDVGCISIDTEMSPWIVGIATEDEVHVFEYDEDYRFALEKICSNGRIVKLAHRWLHDHAFFRKCLDIEVKPPIFDVLGGMHNLNSGLQKELSPHLSTRFTNWGYHKWLSNVDQLHYCGMDAVVAYDAYWPMMQELMKNGLYVHASHDAAKVHDAVTSHDHKLLLPLLAMQAKGFRIDETVRAEVAATLKQDLIQKETELNVLVEPVVEKNLFRFEKPHLFRVKRQCECCGGGKLQREHCWQCFYVRTGANPNADITRALANEFGFPTIKMFKASWPTCLTCKATGKVEKKLEFNPDSPDQLADVIYRGCHIRPRKFKGVETVKAAQLDPIKDKHPIIAKVVEVSEARTEYETVDRLSAGQDGLLHCEFDPWGAETRVASKEGLLEPGTNAQNLPKPARRFVIPRPGYTFLYPDMAQVEARAYAVISGDKNLRKALYETLPDIGKPDYHTWLLRAIRDYDSNINLSRDQSKRVSYAGFFGARPEQLAKELSAEAFRKKTGMQVNVKQAGIILQTLDRVCPEIKRSQTAMCDEVLRTRKLKSPFTGREFAFNGFIMDKKSPGELDYEIKKQVFSRLPQDMAAWVLGLGLIDIYYTSNEWGKLLTPIIHVHDALLIEAPTARLQEAEALALKCLSRYIWGMDFPAESKKGSNWYACS